jgi:N-acyl-D-amino-acid deacylase
MVDVILRGGTVVDGTGQLRYPADVAIVGDRITAIGPVLPKATGARDVSGKIVAPGFIDVHTHDDRALLASPEMAAKTSQGVTTVITGNCGISLSPITLDQSPPPPLDLIGGVDDYAYPTLKKPSVHPKKLDVDPPIRSLLDAGGLGSGRSKVPRSILSRGITCGYD